MAIPIICDVDSLIVVGFAVLIGLLGFLEGIQIVARTFLVLVEMLRDQLDEALTLVKKYQKELQRWRELASRMRQGD